MNLLSDCFNFDDIVIFKLYKKYVCFLLLITISIVILLFVEKRMYYQGSFTVDNEKIVLFTEKEYVNIIKNAKEIELNGIMCDYSINSIWPLNDNYFVDISTRTKLENINNGIYKIYLGKERLFDYMIRIIKE